MDDAKITAASDCPQTSPAPNRVSRSAITVVALSALFVVGIVAYYNYTTRVDYLFAHGRRAVTRGESIATLSRQLRAKDAVALAHFVDGEAALAHGRAIADVIERADQSSVPQLRTQARQAFRDALHEFAQVEAEDELARETAVLAAECLVRLEERRIAADLLSDVVRRSPDCTDAQRWLAAIYIDLNSPRQAIVHLREWGRLDPATGRPFRWIGLFAREYLDDPEEAESAYREALRRRLEPEHRQQVSRELAALLIDSKGQYAEALAALQAQATEVKLSSEELALRAECFWGLGQIDDATREAAQALESQPVADRARWLRAKLHIQAGDPQKALPLLTQAIAASPHDLRCRQLLMETYGEVGDSGRALEQRRLLDEMKREREHATRLHRKAAADPWDDQSRVELGLLYQRWRRWAEAQMWLRSALACNPDNRAAADALAQLANSGRVDSSTPH